MTDPVWETCPNCKYYLRGFPELFDAFAKVAEQNGSTTRDEADRYFQHMHDSGHDWWNAPIRKLPERELHVKEFCAPSDVAWVKKIMVSGMQKRAKRDGWILTRPSRVTVEKLSDDEVMVYVVLFYETTVPDDPIGDGLRRLHIVKPEDGP